MNPLEAPQKPAASRWRAVLLLALVFILGVGTGVGGALGYVRSQIRKSILGLNQRDRIDMLAARIESRMTDSLHLDAQERSAVHDELAVSARRAKWIRLRTLYGVRLLTRDTLSRIGNRLPEEKRAKMMKQANTRLSLWGLEPASSAEPTPPPEPK